MSDTATKPESGALTGAQSLLQTLIASGVDTCFANPGTSEMHLVQAIDKTDGMRPVLTLFEGVAAAAADGYGRMTGRPASTLFHLGPGMANGISQLHNAFRARTPIVNIVGDHATYHRNLDAPLTSDVEGYARPFSGWLRTSQSSKAVAKDAAEAVAAAYGPPGKVATLIVPADCAWEAASGSSQAIAPQGAKGVDSKTIRDIAQALKAADNPVLMLSGNALEERGVNAAGRIAKATGAKLYRATFNGRFVRGAGTVSTTPMPGYGAAAIEMLATVDTLVLASAKEPVSFFAYPDKPTKFVPETCRTLTLSQPDEDSVAALEALADEVGAARASDTAPLEQPDLPRGALTTRSIGQAIAHFLPDNAIICDEGMSARGPILEFTATAPRHDWLELTGGALGQALPLSIGAAIACPDRQVFCLHGDGGALYTIQALWTHARENLNITTVIFSNRSYDALHSQMAHVGLPEPGPVVTSLFDLTNPELTWVELAEGMGVSASRATTAEEFADQFADRLNQSGPGLIEAVL